MSRFTQSDLNKLSKKGMRVTIEPLKKDRVIVPRNDCREVIWIHWNLKVWCAERKLVLYKEYYFDRTRKWRFDFGILDNNNQVAGWRKTGIEYNGLLSDKSRHTTLTGYSGDMEKLNAAQRLGYRVMQYTVLNYKNVLQDLNKML